MTADDWQTILAAVITTMGALLPLMLSVWRYQDAQTKKRNEKPKPTPQQWQPPVDLTDEDREWLAGQMDLAGVPVKPSAAQTAEANAVLLGRMPPPHPEWTGGRP